MSKITAKSAVFSELRFIVNECYNPEKKGIVPFRYYRWNKKLSTKAEQFFYDLTWLLLETDYANEETRCYLKNPWLPLKGVVNELKINGYEQSINQNTVQTKIFRCREKFIGDFGTEVLSNILESSERNLDTYYNTLNKLMVKHGKLDILSLTALKGYCERTSDISEEINDEEFDSFMEMITPYTNRVIEAVIKEIDTGVVGYINYIMNKPNTNGKEQERKEEVINRLGISAVINK